MADEQTGAAIEDFLVEDRTFPPPESFKKDTLVASPFLYDEANEDWQGFWARQAADLLDWDEEWHTILEWDLPFAKWFVGGKLNVCHNAVDRHVLAGRGDKVAYHWEGEPGDTRTITYADLHADVQRFANVLKGLGIAKGDRICIYMPMVPELPVAMLACARIGAPHSVVFGGFSPDSLIDRINDAECKAVITADGGFRRGVPSMLKPNVDTALASTPSIEHVIVVKRVDEPVDMQDGTRPVVARPDGRRPRPSARASRWTARTCCTCSTRRARRPSPRGSCTPRAATSRRSPSPTSTCSTSTPTPTSTGARRTSAGSPATATSSTDPLTNGATSVIYEGVPDTPDRDRLWDIAERYGVTILYTAPTAIRTFMKWGAQEPEKHDLSKLRLLGSVGEPINPEAWMWYHEHIGGGRCPIVDTWWQTETGAIMISPLPGATILKPGSATFPLPGIEAEVVDEAGNRVDRGGGYLTLTRPWPSMLRGIYGDPDRYRETYWSKYPDRYFAGDGCKLDDDGYLWLLGRVDDVMNVSGHRISTTEVESALVDHPAVAEAAVVGANDAVTGQAIMAYVIARGTHTASDELGEEVRQHVAKKLGAIARPKTVIFTDELPKTRSGKIMRRLLRDVAEGRSLGDTTTLADPNVVEEIKRRAAEAPTEE